MASAKELKQIARDFAGDIIGLTVTMINRVPVRRSISISFWDKTFIALSDRYDDNDIVLHSCSDSGSAFLLFMRLIKLDDLKRLASRPVKRKAIIQLIASIIKEK